MTIRDKIIAAMILLKQNDEYEGNSPSVDEAYERLQEALDILDTEPV